MKEVGAVKFDSSLYNDENTLLNFQLISPTKLNQAFTYLWGRDSDKFPLLSMTEGQMANMPKRALNGADTQYSWKIMGRDKLTSRVKRLVTSAVNGLVGAGGSNIVVEMEDNWIPYQMKAWEIKRKQMLEENLWRSRYNRDANGVIITKDPQTNEPIPTGAGVFEQLEAAGNDFTYSNFSRNLLDMIHDHVNQNRIGDSVGEKVLYCGKGFAREFSKALERDAKFNNYFQSLGDKVISGKDGMLSYGAYFGQYKLQDGTYFTLKPINMFNYGSLAELQQKNGQVIDGLPLDSYTAVCLDHSTVTDEDLGDTRNIQVVYEQG